MSLALTRRVAAVGVAAGVAWPRPVRAQTPAADDARTLIDLIFENYAYLERLEGFPERRLRQLRDREAPAVADARALVGFGERALAAMFDHHAILGASRADSYGLVPSYADLWLEWEGGDCLVRDVRAGSQAAVAGIRPGDTLDAVEGVRLGRAIERYIGAPLGDLTEAQRSVCARVLAAGRRDRVRSFTISRGRRRRRVELDNLYSAPPVRGDGPLTLQRLDGGVAHVRLNDSLGDSTTIAAFDAALASAGAAPALIIDLRDTPSGGNTNVARGIMGQFISEPIPYQRHDLPLEQRASGVRRSWVEEVSPRRDRFAGRVVALVGRWTGSMGEGMALGFDAIGARVVGARMAGLLGAIYDYTLPHTGVVLKLPSERLAHVDGRPREDYMPPTLLPYADAPGESDGDVGLLAALEAAGEG